MWSMRYKKTLTICCSYVVEQGKPFGTMKPFSVIVFKVERIWAGRKPPWVSIGHDVDIWRIYWRISEDTYIILRWWSWVFIYLDQSSASVILLIKYEDFASVISQYDREKFSNSTPKRIDNTLSAKNAGVYSTFSRSNNKGRGLASGFFKRALKRAPKNVSWRTPKIKTDVFLKFLWTAW